MNEYRVYVNGNELRFSNVNKKPCLSVAIRLAMDPLNYVELWYVNSSGEMTLCNYWN